MVASEPRDYCKQCAAYHQDASRLGVGIVYHVIVPMLNRKAPNICFATGNQCACFLVSTLRTPTRHVQKLRLAPFFRAPDRLELHAFWLWCQYTWGSGYPRPGRLVF